MWPVGTGATCKPHRFGLVVFLYHFVSAAQCCDFRLRFHILALQKHAAVVAVVLVKETSPSLSTSTVL